LEALERRLDRVERKLGLRCRECGPECRCGDDCECEREAGRHDGEVLLRSDAEKALGSVVVRETSQLMRHRDDGDDDEHAGKPFTYDELMRPGCYVFREDRPAREGRSKHYPLDDWKPVAHWWEHPTGARVWLEYVKYEGAMVQKWRASRPGREEEHLGPFGDVREAVDNALSATAGAAEAGDGHQEKNIEKKCE